MLNRAESFFLPSLGRFEFCEIPTYWYVSAGVPKGTAQNRAFLVTNTEFTWFVESWDIAEDVGKGRMQNKKLYPAKVTGLNIPSVIDWTNTESNTWQDGLLFNGYSYSYSNGKFQPVAFQPGFGQVIPEDRNRPVKRIDPFPKNAPAVCVNPTTGLSIIDDPQWLFFQGAFGRLLSIAAWVDPKIAKEYDKAPKGEKKPESPNKIDYDEYPVNYPPYDIAKNPYYY